MSEAARRLSRRLVAEFELDGRSTWDTILQAVQHTARVAVTDRLPPRVLGIAAKFPADASDPVVYVRRSLHEHRKRFTLAHEWGHLLMGWHAYLVCQEDGYPTSGVGDMAVQEKEANIFAGEILVPERWLDGLLLREMDPLAAIDAAYAARAAPVVVSIRLADHLPPGLMWMLVDPAGFVEFSGVTRGTPARPPVWGSRYVEPESDLIVGRVDRPLTAGRRACWFQYEMERPMGAVPSEPSTDILRRVLHDAGVPTSERGHYVQSIQATAGQVPVPRDSAEPAEIYAVLTIKFESYKNQTIVDTPGFDQFLTRKAAELHERWARH